MFHFKDFSIEHVGENAKLVVNDAYIDDSGEYTCEVWNEVGEQSASFKLTVKGMRLSLRVDPSSPQICFREKGKAEALETGAQGHRQEDGRRTASRKAQRRSEKKQGHRQYTHDRSARRLRERATELQEKELGRHPRRHTTAGR
jgi:hypothetical protein